MSEKRTNLRLVSATEQKWLTTGDMKGRYGVSRMTIHRWEREGRIPKADRTRGRPRWWAPMVDEYDRQAVEGLS